MTISGRANSLAAAVARRFSTCYEGRAATEISFGVAVIRALRVPFDVVT